MCLCPRLLLVLISEPMETGPVGTGAASVGGPISSWRPARRTPRLPSPAFVQDHPGEAYAGPRDEEGEREYSRSLLGCLALCETTHIPTILSIRVRSLWFCRSQDLIF